MGEHADTILDGAFCEACGMYMGEELGYPQRCLECHDEITKREVEEEYQ